MARKPRRNAKSGHKDHQVAALPIRQTVGGDLEVLLVTSRETKRWIIPKGWPVEGLKDHKAAAREALEEAGLVGRISKTPVGSYDAWKRLDDHFVLVRVDVYLLEVEQELATWREKGQRQQRWFRLHEVARLIEEPGLLALVENLSTPSVSRREPGGSGAQGVESEARTRG
jgi:8-oxo-dGTP pyrophosphatase MutT (NUDIX family)